MFKQYYTFVNSIPWYYIYIYIYDNKYASIIDIYFYEYIGFIDLKLLVLALQNILDTLSDV